MMNPQAQTPPDAFGRRLYRLFRDSLFTAALMAAVLVICIRLAVPFLARYKPQLEAQLSSLISAQVHIGVLDVAWDWTGPELSLQRVSLQTSDMTDPLSVGELRLRLDILQMLNEWQLTSNDIKISNVSVQLKRDAMSQWSLNGWALHAGQGETDWQALLAPLHRVTLTNLQLMVEDAHSGWANTFLVDQAYLQRQGAVLGGRVAVQLPSSLGRSLSVSGFGEWGEEGWQGQTHFSVDAIALNAFKPWLPEPYQTLETQGGLSTEAWLEWQSDRLVSAYADYELLNVEVDNTQLDISPWSATRLKGSINWQPVDGGSYLSINPSIQRGDRAWDGGRIDVYWQEGDENSLSLAAQGQHLRLKDLSELVMQWPDAPIWGEALRDLQPEGQISNWAFRFNEGQLLFAEAVFDELGWQHHKDYPAINGLGGKFHWRDGKGQFDLQSAQVTFDYPKLFRNALTLSTLYGQGTVERLGERWQLSTTGLQVDTPHVQSVSRALFQWPVNQGLDMDVQTQLKNANAVYTSLYLPVGVMRDSLVSWLDNGILGGRVPEGNMILRGNTRDFPFRQKQGVFNIDFGIQDASIRFHPDWEPVVDVQGQLHIDAFSLAGKVDSARLYRGDVTEASVGIDNFAKATLAIDGRYRSDLADAVTFANTGPLKRILKPVFRQSEGRGPVDLTLSVRHLLKKGAKTRVDGEITFSENRLNLKPYKLPLEQLSGSLRFDERSVNAPNLQATYLGAPIQTALKTQGKGKQRALTVQTETVLDAEAFFDHMGWQDWRAFAGKSSWQVEFRVPLQKNSGPMKLIAQSRLAGTAIRLPAPLAKADSVPKALKVALSFPSGRRDWPLRIDYGKAFKADVNLGPSGNQLRGLHAVFGQGKGVAAEAGEFRVEGRVERFDVDGWHAWLAKQARAEQTPSKALNEVIRLSAKQAWVNNLRFGNAAFQWKQQVDGRWGLEIDQQYIRGQVSGVAREGELLAAPLRIKLSHLDLALQDLPKVRKDNSAGTLMPNDLPDLQLKLDRLVFGDHTLKNISIKGRNAGNTYRLDRIRINEAHASIRGEGTWRVKQGQHRSSISLLGNTSRLARLVSDFGYPQTMSGGEGDAAFDFSWRAPLLTPSLKSLSGSMALTLKKGRILAVEPGAGRLIGLLAFQELPRRLTLNFSDLTKKGLEFDEIVGRFNLLNGVATTERLVLNGPVGLVELKGKVDYVRRRYDQTIVVLPRLTASLPIIGALTGGIAAGVGVLVADGVLKSLGVNFDEIGKKTYRLTGPWQDPVMEELLPEPSNHETFNNDNR